MSTLSICILCALSMFEAINLYGFSFMGIPALLSLCILFIALVYFIDSWFYYGWGFFTGFVILISLIIGLLNHSYHTIAIIFDGMISLFLLCYFGYKIIQKSSNHL